MHRLTGVLSELTKLEKHNEQIEQTEPSDQRDAALRSSAIYSVLASLDSLTPSSDCFGFCREAIFPKSPANNCLSRGNRYGRFLAFILDSTQRQASLRRHSPARETPRNAPEPPAVPRFSLRNALAFAVVGSAALEIASIASRPLRQLIGRRPPPRRRQNRGNRQTRHRVPTHSRGRSF